MEAMEKLKSWLEDENILSEYKEELSSLKDEKEIEDRFYKELDFGTAGLRGVLGAGINRMNEHTVGKATLGLSRYLKKTFGEAKIAIAYDSRIKSREFAEVSARILAMDHKVFLFEDLRPVPLLSFALRYLGCNSGIVITASHNPKEYNGYKVYDGYGGQVTDEAADRIFEEIRSIKDYGEIKQKDLNSALKDKSITMIGEEVDKAYMESIKTLTIRKSMIKENADKLRIIYSPIHGTGNKPVRRILKELGYSDLHIVKEQELPDGNFPTTSYPNPENPEVFTLAFKLNEELKADIIFATDPDADRLGVIVLDKEGNSKVLTGNQTGMLLTNYILMSLKEEGKLPSNPVVIKTIVTTESVRKICAAYNVELLDVLTGFKYIGEKIEEFKNEKVDEDSKKRFIFGFEESYGYLVGDFVRDKDAVVTSMMVCEMALYYKMRGMTLYDALFEVYETYGFFNEGIISYTKKGIEGAKLIKNSLEYFRNLDLKEINGIKIERTLDYLLSKDINLVTGEEKTLTLPSSNVLKFMLEDDSWFVIRPSGTEPKMKAYFAVKGKNMEDGNKIMETFKNTVNELVEKSFQ